MNSDFRMFPEQASTIAPRVDGLYFYLLGVTAFFTLLIAGLILYFGIKYRRGSRADRTPPKGHFYALELAWIVIPFLLTMVMFWWGADIYFAMARPPENALQINVVGRQWMWKFQHPEGNAEINELHVPRGQPIVLKMISEDVIHAMYVPAFRVKHDVVPGRYVELWFNATQVGQFHLFCAEYCGAKHSEMIGRVVVLEPTEYEEWLQGSSSAQPPALAGQALFEQLRCDNCHRGGGEASRGPPLENLFGSEVKLQDGSTVIANEDYLRESILRPAAKVVTGYQPIMPSFEGQIGEEGILHLIAYIKSKANQQREARP
jgi:cytochrome c oxidase subunit II